MRADLLELATELSKSVRKTAYILRQSNGELMVTVRGLHVNNPRYALLATISPELFDNTVTEEL